MDSQPGSLIEAPNGNTTAFSYDDAGHLVAKQTAAGATNRVSYAWEECPRPDSLSGL